MHNRHWRALEIGFEGQTVWRTTEWPQLIKLHISTAKNKSNIFKQMCYEVKPHDKPHIPMIQIQTTVQEGQHSLAQV